MYNPVYYGVFSSKGKLKTPLFLSQARCLTERRKALVGSRIPLEIRAISIPIKSHSNIKTILMPTKQLKEQIKDLKYEKL